MSREAEGMTDSLIRVPKERVCFTSVELSYSFWKAPGLFYSTENQIAVRQAVKLPVIGDRLKTSPFPQRGGWGGFRAGEHVFN